MSRLSVAVLDLINKSSDLQNVLRAVTQNGKSIMLTAALGAVVVWMYAVVGFAVADTVFMQDDYPDDEIPMCTDLFQCWISIFNAGLRKGDIGEIMDDQIAVRSPFLIFFQFSYYVIVITVLLNVIFGIIIDTFGELRTTNNAKKSLLKNFCFVCGVDRSTLDTRGGGFDRHCKYDHNIWKYVFMMVMLQSKEHTDFNGWEQYVYDQMEASDTNFLPRNRTLTLEAREKKEEASDEQLAKLVTSVQDSLAKRIDKLESTVENALAAIDDRLDEFFDTHPQQTTRASDATAGGAGMVELAATSRALGSSTITYEQLLEIGTANEQTRRSALAAVQEEGRAA